MHLARLAASDPGRARPWSRRASRRSGAALLVLATVLQLLLPAIHELGQEPTRGHAAPAVSSAASGLAARGASATPAHDAQSCPQCQAFAQVRGHVVPALGASLLHQTAVGSRRALTSESHTIAAPAYGCARPRAPPVALS